MTEASRMSVVVALTSILLTLCCPAATLPGFPLLLLATAAAAPAVLLQVSVAEAAASRKKVAARRADALLRAAAVGDAATVQGVLDSGCPPDAADYDRRTGLMLAAANGHRWVGVAVFLVLHLRVVGQVVG
jgi:hypothetical protein